MRGTNREYVEEKGVVVKVEVVKECNGSKRMMFGSESEKTVLLRKIQASLNVLVV